MGIFPLFFLCLFFGSGSSVAEKPPLKAIQKDDITRSQENQIPYSDSVFTDQLDTIPVFNPNPTTPTPVYTSPPTPITQPITTPTAPTTTAPTTTAPTTTAPTTTAPTTTTPAASGGSWCIASQTASDTALQVALDYACGYGGSDCSALQLGSPCYNPSTVRDHASYAFNDYYQKNPIPTSCVFGGTAQLTSTDPSNGNCHYASPRSTPSTPTTTTPITQTPAVPSPAVPSPFVPTTPAFDTPTGSSIYGSEPTGMPSSAVAVSCSRMLLLVVTTGLLGSAIASAY